jgi:hypothetical protein
MRTLVQSATAARGAMTKSDDAYLADFCAQLLKLRASARSEGWTDVLDRIEKLLRQTDAPAGEIVNPLWEYLGLFGLKRGGVLIDLPGQDPAPPPDGAYRCPGGPGRTCSRVVDRKPGEPRPECAFYNEPFRFAR